MKHIFSLLALLLTGFVPVNAQDDNSIGNWNVFVFKGKIAQKYFYNGEFNFRKSPNNPVYDYSEYKILFGRTMNKNWSMDIGTGGYNSSLTGTFLTTQPSRKEIRTWFDLLLKNSYNRLFLITGSGSNTGLTILPEHLTDSATGLFCPYP